MKIHYLQHVEFEGLGSIATWRKGEIIFTSTRTFLNEPFPDIETFDRLIILGGPMGVNDYEQYSWLKEEKSFIRKAILLGKPVLGVCLGAQLIADVLGAKVYKNKMTEIGWFDVINSGATFLEGKVYSAFHWHGDTFTLPNEAKNIFTNNNCLNQGYLYNGTQVIGLQCHFEATRESINALLANCEDEMIEGKAIQSKTQILQQADKKTKEIFKIMHKILEYWGS